MAKRVRQLMMMVILPILFFYCSKGPTGPKTSESKLYRSEFEKIWEDFDMNYSYFILKNIDWNSIKTIYEPSVQEKITYDFFVDEVICPMLKSLKDFHVSLMDKNGNYLPLYTRPIDINYDYNDNFDHTYLSNVITTSNNMFKLGAVADDLGYILIQHWTNEDEVGEFLQIFDSYQSYYENYKGLIIDVRPNGGGSELLARNVAERFTDENNIYAYRKTRNGPNHNDFTSLQSVRFMPSGSWQFTKPIVLLIGEQCVSSNEAFILMMSTLDHVITIGDTTRGSSGNPKEYQLNDGTCYRISTWIAYKSDQTILEDVGIFPDIIVSESESIIGGRDMVLEKAIEVLQ